MQSDGGRQDGNRNKKLTRVARWMCDPHEIGLVDDTRRGREFCEENCKKQCFALAQASENNETVDPATCGAIFPEILASNRLALRCFQSAYWQFASSGMGDAVFPGLYIQNMLSDLGVIGPERVDVMDRIRILDETRRESDRAEDGSSIRAKRNKPEQ